MTFFGDCRKSVKTRRKMDTGPKMYTFSLQSFVFMLKTVVKIVSFQKLLDGDPTKITKMSRKIDELEAIAEKQ